MAGLRSFRPMYWCARLFSPRFFHTTRHAASGMSFRPPFNLDQLSDPEYVEVMRKNVKDRQCDVDIDRMIDLRTRLSMGDHSVEPELWDLIQALPNLTHPMTPVGDSSNTRVIYLHGSKRKVDWPLKTITDLTSSKSRPGPNSNDQFRPSQHIRLKNNTAGSGPRTYIFSGPIAQLETALIAYSLERLKSAGFSLVSVADILPEPVIQACGFPTHGQRSQVEMFALTPPDRLAADAMFDRMLKFQISLYAEMGLHFRVVEMPTSELGNSAHRKVDIEAWMPGDNMYGEISSTSNCLDYQSRRLNIRWCRSSDDEETQFAYTLNGTACAIPRVIKAIMESHQNQDGTITLPQPVRKYFTAGSRSSDVTFNSHRLL